LSKYQSQKRWATDGSPALLFMAGLWKSLNSKEDWNDFGISMAGCKMITQPILDFLTSVFTIG